MVPLPAVLASNTLIRSTLPPGQTALFVGATSGIGESFLKKFAEHCVRPRAYFVGRSRSAGERIAEECKVINPEGEFVFVEKDVSLVGNVDEVCRMVVEREGWLNLVVLSAGEVVMDRRKTPENLHLLTALTYYTRHRFTTLLLPLLSQAPPATPRRIITVGGGRLEGPLDTSDLPALRVPLHRIRGHLSTLITLGLEGVVAERAEEAQGVAFVHVFPGGVQTALLERVRGVFGVVMRAVVWVVGRWTCVPVEECGERMMFLATSDRFPGVGGGGRVGEGGGVPLGKDVQVATGTDGVAGSGVYSVGWDGEVGWSAGQEAMMEGLRERGVVGEVWRHTEGEFARILGGKVGL